MTGFSNVREETRSKPPFGQREYPMSKTSLSAEARTTTGKGSNRRLRAAGSVPAVVYGVGTETMLNVSLKPLDVVKILKSDRGNNTLLTLQIDGTEGPDVLIKDYQIDPVRRTLIQVDILAVSADKPVRVAVPIDFSGLSP